MGLRKGWKFLLSATGGLSWNSNWDYREKDAKGGSPSPPPRGARHLILIRHGQYDYDSGRLTPLGWKQAECTGRRLKELGIKFDSLQCSTMPRAMETAQAISSFFQEDSLIKHDPEDIFREGSPAIPEPRVGSWRPEFHYFRDNARIDAAFVKFFHRAPPSQAKDSYEILVCHANVIRYFFLRSLQLPPEAWLRISLKNGSITWIVIYPSGRVSVKVLGESGHMPPDMLTVSWTDFSNHGERIPNTPFISLKTPLKADFFRAQLEGQYAEAWTPEDVIKAIPDIGAIIDLCATYKYYSPEKFNDKIIYTKIFTEGRSIPCPSTIERFMTLVETLIDSNPNILIGVHCTHGVNRTGFLICYYLIKRLNWSIERAISEFSNYRGHGINRQTYINRLHLIKSQNQRQM